MDDPSSTPELRRRAAARLAAYLVLYAIIALGIGLGIGLLTGFPSWLVSGIGGGVFATFVLGLYHVYKILRGDWRVGGSHETVLRRELSQRQARQLLAATVTELQERNPGFRIVEQSPDRAEISVPMSLWSWGERMSLAAEGDSLRATSRSSLPLQILDWDRNHGNIEELRQSFEQAVRSGPPSVRRPGP